MRIFLKTAIIAIAATLFSACCRNAPQSRIEIEKETFVYAVRGDDSLRLDRYTPAGCGDGERPCMIFVFGGGFYTGQRDGRSYQSYFDYLCRKGYEVVSIDYRLGMKGASVTDAEAFAPLFVRTLTMAVEDLYDATAYVLQHAGEWHIDPQAIVASGSSAGAITVLMGEYGLCNGSPLAAALPEGFDYAGVISFAGAIFAEGEALQWNRRPAPMLLFHGDADRNVPYDAVRFGEAGFFGSAAIARGLTAERAPHIFYTAVDADHAMAVDPMNDNRDEIDLFLDRLVRERQPLMIDTRVTDTQRPEAQKAFTIMDYIASNFAR